MQPEELVTWDKERMMMQTLETFVFSQRSFKMTVQEVSQFHEM